MVLVFSVYSALESDVMTILANAFVFMHGKGGGVKEKVSSTYIKRFNFDKF